MSEVINPASGLQGEIELPGDKSISHRALMIAALAEGESRIENLSDGADVRSTVDCMQKLGVEIRQEPQCTVVKGMGLGGLQQPHTTLDVGNSGTTIRLLSGILAGQPFESQITGDESIRQRPMARIIRPLAEMGAKIESRTREYAPLRITGGHLRPIEYQPPVPSAQVKSSVLLAGLFASGTTAVIEPVSTRDHTEVMLSSFGAAVQRRGARVSVDGQPRLSCQNLFLPGDISSAAFFIAAALLVPNSTILIKNVGINPTRRGMLTVLGDMGADVDIINVRSIDNEMVADLYVKHSTISSMEVQGPFVSQMLDEVPVLAILATQADGVTEISGAGELRYKESDRLRGLKFNLDRMGANVVEKKDGLIITGPTRLHGAEIESFRDHRIAMAFAVAGLIADGESQIKDSECVQVSHPGFFSTLREIAGGP